MVCAEACIPEAKMMPNVQQAIFHLQVIRMFASDLCLCRDRMTFIENRTFELPFVIRT
jgi:hypothetical protein